MSFMKYLTEAKPEVIKVSPEVFNKIEEVLSEASAEELLRKNGFKIKSVHGTKFGTEYLMAKKYPEAEIKDALVGFTLKFDGNSIFVIG